MHSQEGNRQFKHRLQTSKATRLVIKSPTGAITAIESVGATHVHKCLSGHASGKEVTVMERERQPQPRTFRSEDNKSHAMQSVLHASYTAVAYASP